MRCARSPRASPMQITIADLSHLPVESRFVAMMPQWEFLDFLAEEARHYPTFTLRMEAEAVDLLFEEVASPASPEGRRGDPRAADDRRRWPKLGPARQGRLAEEGPRRADRRPVVPAAKEQTPTNETGGTFGAGTLVVQIDRGDYWQCAYVVPKGAAEEIRAKGIEAFRNRCRQGRAGTRRRRRHAAGLGPGQAALGLARPARNAGGGPVCWRSATPRTPCRRSAASASTSPCRMRLPPPISSRVRLPPERMSIRCSRRCRQRRSFPTRVIQAAQKAVHDRVLTPLVLRKAVLAKVPLAAAAVPALPAAAANPGAAVGLGVRREHIRSPDAGLRR